MDSEFERRWRNGQPPFDGLTVRLNEYISLSLLRHGLLAVVERLQSYSRDAALWRLADWHEHDGFVSRQNLLPGRS